MKNLLISFFTFGAMFFLSGCALNQQPENNYFTSKISKNLKLTETESLILADEFIEFINHYYLPSQTMFYVNTNNIDSTFFKTIDTRLRSKGFGLTFDNKVKDVNYLSWHISELEVNNDLLRATYNIDTARVTKIYKRSEDTLFSFGTFTATNLKSPIIIKQLPDFNKISEIEEKAIIEKLTATIKVKTLRIRKKPTRRSKIIGYFKRGEAVKIDYFTTSKGHKWAKLLNQDGFISEAYIKY